jgi:tripartite-type tricarboxylate transporter receptor subunit TctC
MGEIQMKRIVPLGAVAALASMYSMSAMAEWKPSGPITLNIGFKAGGGTDTQARLIGEELSKKLGWKFIFKNVAGKGGSNLARTLKGGPKDGLTIGMAITSTFAYSPLLSKKIGYTADDFDYIISTAPTQMGLVVRKDSGWKNMAEVVAAAKSNKLKFAIMSPRLGDAAYLIAKKYGLKFNTVKAKGGRGVLNGLMAKDIDIGFIAGIHVKGVKAGDLVNVASAEATRLGMSSDVPTMRELGIPYDFGITFVVFAPKGTDPKAKDAIAAAFKRVLSDDKSKARAFVKRAFGEPPLKTGAALAKQLADELANNTKVLATIQ